MLGIKKIKQEVEELQKKVKQLECKHKKSKYEDIMSGNGCWKECENCGKYLGVFKDYQEVRKDKIKDLEKELKELKKLEHGNARN